MQGRDQIFVAADECIHASGLWSSPEVKGRRNMRHLFWEQSSGGETPQVVDTEKVESSDMPGAPDHSRSRMTTTSRLKKQHETVVAEDPPDLALRDTK